ncbi:MAG: hypothetical protein VYD19_03370 [Myxococcota bacterium]|nr:hypothetical protein [Myxococcota bacterium]
MPSLISTRLLVQLQSTLILSCFLLANGPAGAHDWRGQSLSLLAQYHLGDKALTFVMTIPEALLSTIEGASLNPRMPPNVDAQLTLKEKLREAFTKENPVTADGDRLIPSVEKLDIVLPLPPEAIDEEAPKAEGVGIHSGNQAAVLVQLRYPLGEIEPRRLQLRWTLAGLRADGRGPPRFRPSALARAKSRMGAKRAAFTPGLFIYEDDLSPLAFSEREPEFIWHRPSNIVAPEEVTLQSAAPVQQRLPVPTVAFTLIALIAALSAWRRTDRSLKGFSFPAICVLSAVLLWSWRPIPIYGSAAPLEDRFARQISELLLQQTYQAFARQRPEEVYDALAESVSGQLLDWTYQEIHQSLVLREQGGAVATVERVTLLDWDRLDWENPEVPAGRAFAAKIHWRVQGLVDHWGHQHRRVNEYKARYEVLSSNQGWRVVGLKILDHRRRPSLEFIGDLKGGDRP